MGLVGRVRQKRHIFEYRGACVVHFTDMDRPFSEACERNQGVICDVLTQIVLPTDRLLFEIGSGTGQHAAYCASYLPNVTWTTSDIKEKHEGIQSWIKTSTEGNIEGPIEFEIGKSSFPKDLDVDIVFTANTLHILPWEKVQTMFEMIGTHLKENARFCVYGPFSFDGKFTASSNQEFDKSLRKEDPQMGVREMNEVRDAAAQHGLTLMQAVEMPANNHFLIFQKL